VDFELDDDQLELQRIVRDVVERECPPALVRAVVAGDDDGTDLWKTLVELDWPSLTVPAAAGGMGASAVELVVTLEELGRVADPTPFLATTSQYVPVVRAGAGDGDVRQDLLTSVCAGGTGAVAWATDALACGPADPDALRAHRDPTTGRWRLDGTAHHVLDGDRADRIAVVAQLPHPAADGGEGGGADGEVVVLVVAATDVAATRRPSFDATLHVADVVFEGVEVEEDRAFAGPGAGRAVARARDEAVTGLAAVTVGACQRILDLVVAHVKERHQFGVPIGSFQAVQHMAVDVHVAIERARALVRFAALTLAEAAGQHPADGDDDRCHVAASLAKAAAGDAQRIAARHGIQLFGGLGFTWENDLQLFVRRAKAGELLLGTTAEHRARVARSALGGGAGAEPMRLALDDATEAFRRELGTWLDENAPDEATTTARSRSSADIPDWARAWQRKMFDAGWLVPGNPPELGGRNATLVEQFVHREELGRRRVYPSFNPQGLGIVVPSILAYGTDEQKRRWAVPLLRGEITAALGMSEPDAGSDLAALRTRAVLDGDRFVVNGQKVWTSGAQHADVILTFVRTDPDAPKHKGISVLLVPTGTPGLTRRPFGSMVSPDERDFNEVFFDDVEVPAENLVGELNGGWRVATGSLGHERAMLWLGFAERLDDLVDHGATALAARALADDPVVLDWFGDLVADAHALRLLGYRTLAKARRGIEATEQSILKLLGSEAVQEATLHVLEALGPDGLDPARRTAPHEPLNWDGFTTSWFERYLRSFPGTIAGGTSQIQRNIVAERVLGLPRS
jgi:alkylation response protein AidB-like acyl-CoA dehydrogenase